MNIDRMLAATKVDRLSQTVAAYPEFAGIISIASNPDGDCFYFDKNSFFSQALTALTHKEVPDREDRVEALTVQVSMLKFWEGMGRALKLVKVDGAAVVSTLSNLEKCFAELADYYQNEPNCSSFKLLVEDDVVVGVRRTLPRPVSIGDLSLLRF